MKGITVFVTGDVSRLKAALKDAERGVNAFGTATKRNLKAIEGFAAPAAVAFAGLSLAIGATVKRFGDLEAALNQTKAVSGATAREMAALKKQALELGAATKFSALEAAQGQAELAKAGFTVQQTLAATAGVMSLAAAGGVSVAQAAEAAGAALNGFGLSADQSGKVADILAKTANVSAVSISDLQNSLKYIAPIASSTSQSLEEVNTVLAILGNAGIKSETAGTAIRSSLTSLVKPSEEAAKKLGELGISIQDSQGKMLPFTGIIDQFRSSTEKMSEAQRANAIATIFGQEALTSILALMKQTPAQVKAAADAVRDFTGAAKQMGDDMNSGLNGAIEKMGGSIDALMVSFGEEFAPLVIKVANMIEGLADAFNALDPGLKAVIAGGAAAATAMAGLVAVVGGGAGLVALMGLLGGAVGPVTIAITALSLAVGAATLNATIFKDEAGKTADALVRQKGEVAALTKEYEALKGKTSQTADEKKRMQVILKTLSDISPDLVSGYNSQGEAIGLNRTATEKYITVLDRLIAKQYEAAEAERVRARESVAAQKVRLQDMQAERAKLRRDLAAAPKTWPQKSNQAVMLEGMIADLDREIAAQAQSVQEAQAGYSERYLKKATPAPAPKPSGMGGRTGGASGSGAGSSSGPSAASSAIDAARQLAEEEKRLAKEISDAYAEAALKKRTDMETANGGIRLESQRLVEEDEALAKEIADLYGAAAREKQQNMEAANGKIEEAGWKLADSLSESFGSSIREIQGDITALAIDPSLERVANFAKSLTADEAKMARFGQVVSDVGDAFSKASKEGGDGFAAAMGKVGAAINPVSLAVMATVGIVMSLVDAFDRAAAAQERLKQSATDYALNAKRLRAQLTDDPVMRADQERDVALDELQGRRNDALQQAIVNYRDSRFGTQEYWDGTLAKKLSQGMTLDDFPDLKTQYDLEEQLILKTRNEKVKAAEETAKATTDATKTGISEEEAARKDYITRWVDEMRAANLELQRLADDRAKAEQRIADLMKQQRDLRADLVNLDKEEEQRIKGILSEGIAQRQETETQNKTRRVGEVRDEFGARRSDVNARLAAIQRQIEEERTRERVAAQNARMERESQLALQLGARYAQQALHSSIGTIFGTMPKYHNGGDVSGRPGAEVPAILKVGERVLTEPQARAMDRSGGGVTVNVTLNAGHITDKRDLKNLINTEVGKSVKQAMGTRR